MRIEKVHIVDAQLANEKFELGPFDGGQSVTLIGDSSDTWLKAIIFALGYSNDLQSLSTEFQNFDGSIEIIFNAEQNDVIDAFFENFGGTMNKISLRRSIRMQQIEYFLNGFRVERMDVKNFLQIFGFAESYPFQYSVHSKDIEAMEIGDAKYRLICLKDCCGVDDFYKKRNKSLRILAETAQEIQKIDESLAKIDVQLNIFASNEMHQIYQNWVKREKELGHFKRLYRIKAVQAELKQQKLDIDAHLNKIASNKTILLQNVDQCKAIRREIKLIGDSVNERRQCEQRLGKKIDECKRETDALEKSLVELQAIVQQGSFAEDLSMQEKQMYREKINETNHRISDIDAEIERVAERKYKLDQQVSELDEKAATILMNCQQNQRLGTQFQTVTERNEHLLLLMKRTKNVIARENRNINRLKTEIQGDEHELNVLKTALTEHNKQLTEMNAEDETQSFHQQQETYNSLEEQRFELMEQNESLLEKSRQLKLNLDDVYDKLCSQIGNSMFNGFNSMEAFMRKAANRFEHRYFGRVIDIFTCDNPISQEMLPKLMGEYLFYYVVDTPQTATQILFGLNASDLPGEVNFFALSIIDNDEYHHHEIIERLSFDAKFQKLFEKICDNANDLSQDSGFTEENGALIGIKSVSDINPMELYHKQKELIEMHDATHYEMSENSYRIDMTIDQINGSSEWLQKRHQTMSKIQQVQSSIVKLTQTINVCEERIRRKENELQKYEAKVNQLMESKILYETEMSLDLLTEQEATSMDLIQREIIAINEKLQKIIIEMNELQKRRDTISDYYENSLISRYSVLEEQSMMHSNNSAELNRRQKLLVQSEEDKRQIGIELARIRGQIIDLLAQQEEKKQNLQEFEEEKAKINETQKSMYAELNVMKLQLKTLSSELNWLRAQKPYDATQIHNPDIVDMPEEDINNHLHIARHQLKTYTNTNNFDFNILDTFQKDRTNFRKRRDELTRIESKIRLVIEKLEENIQTSIKNTFDNLAAHFERNFENFVPGGAARLQLIEETSGNSTQAVANVGQVNEENSAEAIGIDLFARFDEIEQPFDHLFGQKRRVVALLFIISMQQLCPAPFYLFHSVEELVLDPYLQPLIAYMNNLSNESQIIATTRQRDLLKGPNFIDNTFRMTMVNGKPKMERI